MSNTHNILVLHKWPVNSYQKIWTSLKIFLKETIFYGDWKTFFANKNIGGKQTLSASVTQGFRELKVDFLENIFETKNTYKTCYVLKDVQCLTWALEQKKRGRIQRLVVGPMIVNFPFENNRLIENKLIDVYILPSQWILNLFNKLSHSQVNYKVWAVGVDMNKWRPTSNKDQKKWIIYVKNPDQGLLLAVQEKLDIQNIQYVVIHAGFFKQTEYLSYLSEAQAVVFLSRSETQGLAMFEAWSCNIPTLHWNPKEFRLMNHVYPEASSCPYLTDQCGLEFANLTEFDDVSKKFIARISEFEPRNYIEKKFQLLDTAKELLNL